MNKDLALKYFREPPVIHTERLTLRKILKSDAADVFEFSSDPTVTKYLLWKPHINFKYTQRYLAFMQSRYRAGEFYDWGVVDSCTGKLIGTCGFTEFDYSNNSAEVGYVLNHNYWHRGIAAEALFEVLKFGFLTLGLNRIEARYMVGNENSRHVMEKVGMRFEGIKRNSLFIDDRYVSVGSCAILKDEFLRYLRH